MLAIALGYSNIALLGYDLKINTEKNKTHWHDGYSHQTNINYEKQKMFKFIKNFNDISNMLTINGINIINLNPDSALKCFEKKDIKCII